MGYLIINCIHTLGILISISAPSWGNLNRMTFINIVFIAIYCKMVGHLQGRRNRGGSGGTCTGGTCTGGTCPPPNFFKGLKVPFFVTKSAIFVQANVAVNAKLTSKVPFLFGNFQVLLKYLVQNVQFRYGTTGKIPPCRQHFREKVFRCPFQYPKVPLEAGAPQSFDASYAPGHLTNIYCPTVGHLIENLLKKSNAPPMPDPPPSGA